MSLPAPFGSRIGIVGLPALLVALLWISGSAADTSPHAFMDPLGLTGRINDEIARGWRAAKVADPKPADDAEFLRRLSLDLNGVIPARAEVIEFLRDKSRDKRAKKIDELLARPAYAEHMARLWTNLLAGRTYRDPLFKRDLFQDWFEKAFAANLPYDEMIRSLLTAKGVNDENAAANLYVRYAKDMNPADIAGALSRNLLGVQIQCAQCHNHPYEPWTQEDFWGFAAFFARVRPRPVRTESMMPKDMKAEVIDLRNGEVYLPDSDPRRPVYPKYLGVTGPDPVPNMNRREALTRWIVSGENPTFAKSIVNRIWAMLLGRGIVEPIDDFSKKHAPSHPELLDALASAFLRNGYDLRYLFRAICNSRVYQIASGPQAKDEAEEKLFGRAQLKPLSPEQLFYSLLQLGGTDRKGLRADRPAIERQREQYLRQFVFLFGNDEQQESDEFKGTLQQVLYMMNDPNVAKGLQNAGRAIAKMEGTDADRVDALFLTALSRPASSEEKRQFGVYLSGATDRPQAYEDLFWSLLNTTEFIYNH